MLDLSVVMSRLGADLSVQFAPLVVALSPHHQHEPGSQNLQFLRARSFAQKTEHAAPRGIELKVEPQAIDPCHATGCLANKLPLSDILTARQHQFLRTISSLRQQQSQGGMIAPSLTARVRQQRSRKSLKSARLSWMLGFAQLQLLRSVQRELGKWLRRSTMPRLQKRQRSSSASKDLRSVQPGQAPAVVFMRGFTRTRTIADAGLRRLECNTWTRKRRRLLRLSELPARPEQQPPLVLPVHLVQSALAVAAAALQTRLTDDCSCGGWWMQLMSGTQRLTYTCRELEKKVSLLCRV